MVEKAERRFAPKSEKGKKTKVGKILKRMRDEHGYKQHEVEKALGMTSQHLSDIERDKGNPPLLTLAMITEFYGYEVADLFLPARIYKEYPNKRHRELHARMQEYIERGHRESSNIKIMLEMALDETPDET